MLLTSAAPHFQKRREQILAAHPNATFLFPAAPEATRNHDVHHPYRQDSTFYYLTGFEEPESFLVLAKGKSILFVRKRDPMMEIWEGERHGIDGALKVFGVDEAYVIDELDQRLVDFIKGAEKIYYRMNQSETNDRHVMAALEKARKSQGRSGKGLAAVSDPNEVVGEMRLIKSGAEIESMSKASRVTALAHKHIMKTLKPGMNEWEIEAMIDFKFRMGGCQRLGYGSIVAGGKNACCLHYRANNEVLRDGDLILIDAGGETDYYTADITRTFPVGKKFSTEQAQIYDLVLKVQKEAIAMVKPGMSQVELHQFSCRALTEGLLSLGLLSGRADEIVANDDYKRFYPHGTGHWLGMDVHDCGLYQLDGKPRKFQPGMAFTIEPGLYIQPGDREANAKFRGIGIRIEDDILVTEKGCEVLTRDVPKERGEIEELRAQAY